MSPIQLGDDGPAAWSDIDEFDDEVGEGWSGEDGSSSSSDEFQNSPAAVDYTPLDLLHERRSKVVRARRDCPDIHAGRQPGVEFGPSDGRNSAPAGYTTHRRLRADATDAHAFRRGRHSRIRDSIQTFTNLPAPPRRASLRRVPVPNRADCTASGDNHDADQQLPEDCVRRRGGRRPASQQRRSKKNGNWTDEQLRSALAAVDNGLSMRLAAQRNNIPYSSFRDWCYGHTRSRRRGKMSVLTPEEESELVQYLIRMCDAGFGLSPTALKMKVYEMTKTRCTPFTDGIPGGGWMRWFKRRHPELSIRAAQALETARAKSLCPENVASLYSNLEELYGMHKYPTHRIWNCDESGAQAGMFSLFKIIRFNCNK